MFKVTQLDSGAGIQIQAVLLQFRNKIDKFSFLLFFLIDKFSASLELNIVVEEADSKQTHKYIEKRRMRKVSTLGKSYGEKNRV